MSNFFKAIFNLNTVFPWILILISAFLCFKSFVPGTWLSGWDTLHPEFNFELSFARIFNGVFRSEQGLGAVAAHAHMSDLPRVILLFLASIILPESILRYLFISLCLIIGVLGTYFFIKKEVLKNSFHSSPFAFLGALFYLFNLGTLQHFYVPFEMFTVAYAFLPWLFLLATRYLMHPNYKNLLWFGIITLLSTPMAFASTLWFAYFLALILYLVIFARAHFKKVLTLIFISLAINSFWLLPTSYYIVSGNASWVSEAKSNKIFSEEAFSFNQSYGIIQDAVVFKNFLFDWSSFDGKSGFEYLFISWKDHINSSQTQILGYILAVFAISGIILAIISKNKVAIALILPSLLAVVFLINQNPPLDGLFSLFREKIPLFSESLRFPFTKFSIILMFSFSCFFALGQKIFYELISKLGWKKVSLVVLMLQLVIFSAVFYTYMKPEFEGDFISKKVQVVIPQDYFDMFKWFESQPKEGRIANFPVNSLFGWVYYSWGFQGAQFISFGLKQPLLDRDFDRWNPQNEQYFREMSYAVYSQNVDLLSKVIEKYKIKYLIVDRNVVNPGSRQDKTTLYFDQTESLLASIKDIKPVRSFGKISVWEVSSTQTDLISTPDEFIQITGKDGPLDIDFAYKNFGSYINFQNLSIPTVNYPNRSLIDNQNLLVTKLNLPQQNLNLNRFTELESSMPVSVYLKQEGDNLLIKLIFEITGQEKNISINHKSSELLINLDSNQTLRALNINDKEFTYQGDLLLSTKSINTLSLYDFVKDDFTSKVTDIFIKGLTVEPCSEISANSEEGLTIMENRSFRITAKAVNACVRIPLNKVVDRKDLEEFKSLVNVSFATDSKTNTAGHYCLFNKTLNRCVIEQKYLPLSGRINDYFTVDADSLDNLDLILYVDGIGNNKLSEVVYSNLTLSVKNYFDLITIFPEEIKSFFSNKIALNQDLGNSENIDIIEKGHEANSCSNIVPVKFSRIVDYNQKTVEYSSEEGSSCDYFSLPNLYHNIGYLLTIESQNVTGLPLRICLANPQNKHCDLYISLPKNKQLKRETIVIPPISDGGVGYNLHFDNYSTGRIVSTNKVRTLEIKPFPYYWLSEMYQPANIKSKMNLIKINYVKELIPNFIEVNFSNSSNKYGLLVLNRGFEEGWLMLDVEHVKVNGWANGWLIKPNQGKSAYIFFWPQLLEWGGLVLMVGTFIFLLLKRNHTHA